MDWFGLWSAWLICRPQSLGWLDFCVTECCGAMIASGGISPNLFAVGWIPNRQVDASRLWRYGCRSKKNGVNGRNLAGATATPSLPNVGRIRSVALRGPVASVTLCADGARREAGPKGNRAMLLPFFGTSGRLARPPPSERDALRLKAEWFGQKSKPTGASTPVGRGCKIVCPPVKARHGRFYRPRARSQPRWIGGRPVPATGCPTDRRHRLGQNSRNDRRPREGPGAREWHSEQAIRLQPDDCSP
jgi:hypothetical protein